MEVDDNNEDNQLDVEVRRLDLLDKPNRCLWREVYLCLQAYATHYTGNAKLNRLLFIAGKLPGTPTELDALRLAADELRKARLFLQAGRSIKQSEEATRRICCRGRTRAGMLR